MQAIASFCNLFLSIVVLIIVLHKLPVNPRPRLLALIGTQILALLLDALCLGLPEKQLPLGSIVPAVHVATIGCFAVLFVRLPVFLNDYKAERERWHGKHLLSQALGPEVPPEATDGANIRRRSNLTPNSSCALSTASGVSVEAFAHTPETTGVALTALRRLEVFLQLKTRRSTHKRYMRDGAKYAAWALGILLFLNCLAWILELKSTISTTLESEYFDAEDLRAIRARTVARNTLYGSAYAAASYNVITDPLPLLTAAAGGCAIRRKVVLVLIDGLDRTTDQSNARLISFQQSIAADSIHMPDVEDQLPTMSVPYVR